MKPLLRSALVVFLVVLGVLGIWNPHQAANAAPAGGTAATPTPCASPAAPTLVAPADRALVTSFHCTFDWNDVPGAARYDLEIDDDPAFGSWFGVALTPQSQYTAEYRIPDGYYYWRVCAISACGAPSPWSETRTFTACTSPPAPGLLSPADGATVPPTNILLDWSDVAGTDQYMFQVDDDPAFGSPQFAAPSSSQWNIETFAPGTYYWRAKVYRSPCEGGDWSETWHFVVLAPASATPSATPPPPATDTPTATPPPPATSTPTASPSPTASSTPTVGVPATTGGDAASSPVAATSTPTPTPPAQAGRDGWPCWRALLVGLVVVGGLLVSVVLRRRRRPHE